jgi:hypothetical protein
MYNENWWVNLNVLKRNRPMREVMKFRTLKERDCATVAERYRILRPLPFPRFASLRVLLGNAMSIGSRNGKEGRRDLSRHATIAAARCFLCGQR